MRLSQGRLGGLAWPRPLPGLVLIIGLALAAIGLEQGLRWLLRTPTAMIEALVLALLLGMVIRNTIGQPAATAAGVSLAGKGGLELAVVLLGASLDLGRVVAAGPRLAVMIALCVALALGAALLVGRWLGLGQRLALLVAVGTAICGNSAIAATAPVIRADKREVASAIALTAVVGVAVVLTLPLLAPLLQLSAVQYGVLVGTTVYAVPQVVAAAFPVSVAAGEVATMVKLARVLLIGPIVVLLGLIYRQPGTVTPGWRQRLPVPWFVVGFVMLTLIASSGLLATLSQALGLAPAALATGSKEISRLLMIAAMAALGLGVQFAAIRLVGRAVALTVALATVLLVIVSLGLIALLGL